MKLNSVLEFYLTHRFVTNYKTFLTKVFDYCVSVGRPQ